MLKYPNISIHAPTIIHVSYTFPTKLSGEGITETDCTNDQLHNDVHGQSSLGLQQGTALVFSVDVTFVTLMYTGSLILGPQSTVHHTVGKELILELCTYETLIVYQY